MVIHATRLDVLRDIFMQLSGFLELLHGRGEMMLGPPLPNERILLSRIFTK